MGHTTLRQFCAVCIAVTILATPAWATVDVVIRGLVRDENITPLPGATVILHDARGFTVQETRTDSQGEFVFRGVEFGDYTVEATAPGKVDDHRHIQVTTSETGELELYCLNQQNSHTVVEEIEAPKPTRATGSVSTLSREDLKSLPKGEDRPITEVISTQPGFVLDAFGNVYARGNHANIQYQVDGIPIPDSVGNLFAAALPVRLIENLELFTGGMPAEFGNRLAAVVNIASRHASATPEGVVQIRYGSFQTLEPSLSYSRAFGRFGVFVGGSYLQSERALDAPAVTPILHDDGKNGRLFLRVDFKPSDRNRFELFSSYAYNAFQIPIDPTVVPLDPTQPNLVRPTDSFGNASPPYRPHDTDATETENEVFVALSWIHTFAERGQLQVAPYFKLSAGALRSDPMHALGPLADPGSTASDVDRSATHGGVVIHYSLQRGRHFIKAGVQTDLLAGTTSYAQFVRDDVAGGPDPAQTSRGTDQTSAVLSGAYLQDRWDHGRLGLNAGVRFDELHVSLRSGRSDDHAGVSPRVGASFAFRESLIGHVFVGVNWQPPAPLDAGNAARALGLVPPNTDVPYDIKPQTDVYGELGLDGRIRKRLRVGAVGWARYAWNQLDDTAIGATNLIANYNFERGRAVGVEGKMDLVVGTWLTAFANTSWEIAQGQGIASAKFLFTTDQLANPTWQTLDHAQTLTANLGATFQDGPASFTALASYGSGLRTGAANTKTVPDHVRVDATLQYAFDKIPLRPRAAIDLINLFDSHYAFRIANGFVGSSYAPPRSAFVRLSFPLDRGGVR